jgi:hypothetical protein
MRCWWPELRPQIVERLRGERQATCPGGPVCRRRGATRHDHPPPAGRHEREVRLHGRAGAGHPPRPHACSAAGSPPGGGRAGIPPAPGRAPSALNSSICRASVRAVPAPWTADAGGPSSSRCTNALSGGVGRVGGSSSSMAATVVAAGADRSRDVHVVAGAAQGEAHLEGSSARSCPIVSTTGSTRVPANAMSAASQAVAGPRRGRRGPAGVRPGVAGRLHQGSESRHRAAVRRRGTRTRNGLPFDLATPGREPRARRKPHGGGADAPDRWCARAGRPRPGG